MIQGIGERTPTSFNYVEELFTLAARVLDLLPTLQQSRSFSSIEEKKAYLRFTERSLSLHGTHGYINSALGVAAAVVPLFSLKAPPEWAPLLQAGGGQIPHMGSALTEFYLASANEAEKRGQLSQLALQSHSSERQTEEQLQQGATSLVHTLCETLSRASRSQ
ncbi:MAG: hypothetical protein KGI80_06520 [Verrucomicrobiota bacterium]|nr:hypothetical protein [Verrucomicrobiota bacterium]